MEASLSAQRVVQEILSKQSANNGQPMDKLDPADLERFQEALKQDISKMQGAGVEKTNNLQKSYGVEATQNAKGVGDKILNNLSDLRTDYQSTIQRVQGILNKGSGVSTSDMLKIQMDLMVMGLKQETVGKITQKSSQNLDSLLKSG